VRSQLREDAVQPSADQPDAAYFSAAGNGIKLGETRHRASNLCGCLMVDPHKKYSPYRGNKKGVAIDPTCINIGRPERT